MCTVLVRSDNMAVVQSLSSGTARGTRFMHLLCCLHFLAHHEICIQAHHVADILNSASDALSCNNMALFFHCTLQAAREPTPVPDQLVHMLVLQCPDWTVGGQCFSLPGASTSPVNTSSTYM